MELVLRAAKFAAKAHAGQVRKYTGEPYIAHCFEVAQIVAPFATEEMIAAAILHDTVEDCDVRLPDLLYAFNPRVTELVYWLTDVSKPKDGNRAARKALDRDHIANAPIDAKTIKLADLISNTKSIVHHDPDFAKVYLAEKQALLDVLRDGEPLLWREAARLAGLKP